MIVPLDKLICCLRTNYVCFSYCLLYLHFLMTNIFLVIKIGVIVTFNLLERIYNICSELLFIGSRCLKRFKLKKSFKLPNWYSEAVIRRIDNRMDKSKRTKEQTMIYKTLHLRLQLSNTNPTKTQERTHMIRKIN